MMAGGNARFILIDYNRWYTCNVRMNYKLNFQLGWDSGLTILSSRVQVPSKLEINTLLNKSIIYILLEMPWLDGNLPFFYFPV